MTLQASAGPLVEAYDLALVDLDGVVYRGPEPVTHAVESLLRARRAGAGLAFVTNNAFREPGSVALQLTGLGVAAQPDEVFTSAQAAAALLADEVRPGARVLVVGGPGLLTAVRAAGFEVVGSAMDGPDAVVQGFAPDVSWRELAEAAYAIQRGARHIASNRDLTLPSERGVAPGNGSLVAAVVAATGVEPLSAGKPEPTLFRLATRSRGASRPLVVGDRLDTDIAGARAAGFPGLHVLTGVSSGRDVVLAPRAHRPDFLGEDLRSLHAAHPVPEWGPDGWWSCRGAAARVVDRGLDLRIEGAEPIDVLRAACAAAWAAADGGAAVDPARVPDPVGTCR